VLDTDFEGWWRLPFLYSPACSLVFSSTDWSPDIEDEFGWDAGMRAEADKRRAPVDA